MRNFKKIKFNLQSSNRSVRINFKMKLSMVLIYTTYLHLCAGYCIENITHTPNRFEDWNNRTDDISAEYNFFDVAFALFDRFTGESRPDFKYENLFNQACLERSRKYLKSISENETTYVSHVFPNHVREINWSNVNNTWTDDEDYGNNGYIAMLDSFPLAFFDTLYASVPSGLTATEYELWILLYYGEKAVTYRELHLTDASQAENTKKLREFVEKLGPFVVDYLHYCRSHNETDKHYHCGKRHVLFKEGKYLHLLEGHWIDGRKDTDCITLAWENWNRSFFVYTRNICIVLFINADCSGRSVVLIRTEALHNKYFQDQVKSFRAC